MTAHNVLLLYESSAEETAEALEAHLGAVGLRLPIQVDRLRVPADPGLIEGAWVVVILLSKAAEKELSRDEVTRLGERLKVGRPTFILKMDDTPIPRTMANSPVWPHTGHFGNNSELRREQALLGIAEATASAFQPRGQLCRLALENLGPGDSFVMEPGARFNLITGDNGLGKSFLLECVWWALSGRWSDYPALPRLENRPSSISIGWRGEGDWESSLSSAYDRNSNAWPDIVAPFYNLSIYSRADGSFCVWDPTRHLSNNSEPEPFLLTRKQVWQGLFEDVHGERRTLCRGILDGWIHWQRNEPDTFAMFSRVLSLLADEQQGELPLKPGPPARVLGYDQELPTLVYPYGTVSVVHAAASVQRVIGLAYMLVWTWGQYQQRVGLYDAVTHMTVLVDEIEAHLHPRWMRGIIPALDRVGQALMGHLQVQYLITTHGPLVLTGLEPMYDEVRDKLFCFSLDEDLQQARLEELPFHKHGRADLWMTSPSFGLGQARSFEAERVIADALALQREEQPKQEEVLQIHEQLTRVLGEHDGFWSRWLYFAEQQGVGL